MQQLSISPLGETLRLWLAASAMSVLETGTKGRSATYAHEDFEVICSAKVSRKSRTMIEQQPYAQ